MVGGQQQPVTDRLIFTDAPQQYNTVAVREELLAAALLGSASKKLLVHEVLKKHQYILTLDYTMEMLHLEVCQQCVGIASLNRYLLHSCVLYHSAEDEHLWLQNSHHTCEGRLFRECPSLQSSVLACWTAGTAAEWCAYHHEL